jgi:HAD superfamily hydrolase (TIGR01509 family)
MKKINIPIIIFDMDGLMFDTERISISAWKKAGEEFDYNIEEKHCVETIGLYFKNGEEIFKNYFGENFPFLEIRELKEKYVFKYIEENGVPVKDGLYDLLNYLEQKDILKGLATSTVRKKTEKLLEMANIKNRFDYILCGDEIINGKPDPDIFNCLAHKANCCKSECIVLEDSENGIIAASKAEMKPVFIQDIKKLTEDSKKLLFKEFKSLLEFNDYLKTIL